MVEHLPSETPVKPLVLLSKRKNQWGTVGVSTIPSLRSEKMEESSLHLLFIVCVRLALAA